MISSSSAQTSTVTEQLARRTRPCTHPLVSCADAAVVVPIASTTTITRTAFIAPSAAAASPRSDRGTHPWGTAGARDYRSARRIQGAPETCET